MSPRPHLGQHTGVQGVGLWGEEGKEVLGERVCAAELPDTTGLRGRGTLCSGKASRFLPRLRTLSGHGNLGVCSPDLGPTPWEWVGG